LERIKAMSKKAKLLILALTTALLLTAGATAVVIAQDEPAAPPETDGLDLVGRVAQILGIPQDDLEGASKQARQEMRQDEIDKVLNGAVEKGLITEGEAIEIKEWMEQRPEAMKIVKPYLPHKHPPKGGKGAGKELNLGDDSKKEG
jgi:hypothetical protein